MKRILLITLFLVPIVTLAQKQSAVPNRVTGKVNFPKGDETGRVIYFVYAKNGTQKLDSSVIVNNKFSFAGIADINLKAALQLTKPGTTPEPALDPNTLSLYLNNGLTDVKATGFLMRAQVFGSAMQDEYVAFVKKYSIWDKPLTGASRRKRNFGKTDSVKLKIVNKTIDSLQNIKMDALSAFLNEGTGKPYAVEAILMYLRAKGSSLDVGKAEAYFKRLPDEQKHAASGQQVEQMIAELKKHQ